MDNLIPIIGPLIGAFLSGLTAILIMVSNRINENKKREKEEYVKFFKTFYDIEDTLERSKNWTDLLQDELIFKNDNYDKEEKAYILGEINQGLNERISLLKRINRENIPIKIYKDLLLLEKHLEIISLYSKQYINVLRHTISKKETEELFIKQIQNKTNEFLSVLDNVYKYVEVNKKNLKI